MSKWLECTSLKNRIYVFLNCCFKLYFNWYLAELLFFVGGEDNISYEYAYANVNLKQYVSYKIKLK